MAPPIIPPMQNMETAIDQIMVMVVSEGTSPVLFVITPDIHDVISWKEHGKLKPLFVYLD